MEIGDRAGIAVAFVCALHCVAAPLAGASVQVAGTLASERTELLFLASSLLISGTMVLANCLRRGARRAVWGAFGVGASLLLCARVGLAFAERIEQPLVLAGAGMIVAAHVMNLFNCRCREEGPSCVAAE
jgi:hypothetical protein